MLNFEKINKILDSYLTHRMEMLDKQRKKKKPKVEDNLSPEPDKPLVLEAWKPPVLDGPASEDKPAFDLGGLGFVQGMFSTTSDADVIKKVRDDLITEDIKANKGNIMDVFVAMTQNKQEKDEGGKEVTIMSRRKPGETLEIHEYLQQEKKENFLEQLSKAWYISIFFTINDFVIALLPVIQLEGYESNEMTLNFYQLSEFLCVFSLLSPIVTFKTDRAILYKSRLIQFKLVVTLLLIVFSNILQFSPIPLGSSEIKENKNVYYLWCVLSLLKITSVHDLLKFSKEYLLILETFTQIMPLLGDLFVQLLLLMLFYCVIGVHMFGGLVHDKTKEEYKAVVGDNMSDNYEMLTFNDIPSGLLLLYVIAIMNDWSKIMTHAMVTLKDDWPVFKARLFFLSFFMLGIMLVLNTTIGTIIAFINTYLSMLQEGGDLGIEAEEENKFDVVMNMFSAREEAKRENTKQTGSSSPRKRPDSNAKDNSDSSSEDEDTKFKKAVTTKTTSLFPDE